MSWVAGIVVIGDEMLSGKVEDTNTPFLCRELHKIGWTVRKVRMSEVMAAPADYCGKGRG
jgi:molybdopterin-biosynthesis enzyme MoeA-like protein